MIVKKKDKEMIELDLKKEGAEDDAGTDPRITAMGMIEEVETVQRVSPSPTIPPPKNPNPYVQREQLPVTADDIAPLFKDKSAVFAEAVAHEEP